jgi:hypothetical protein
METVAVIRQYINGILAALALLGAALLYRKGRTDERTREDIRDWNEYIATRDRMESADPGSDVDQWLRDRAKRDGTL